MSHFTISVIKKYNLVYFSKTKVSFCFEPYISCVQHGTVWLCSWVPRAWVLPSPGALSRRQGTRPWMQPTSSVSPTSLFPLLPCCLSAPKAPLIKDIYENPTDNVILNRERQNAFSLRSGAGQHRPPLLLLLNIVLEVLARASSQENEIKIIQIKKVKKVKPSLFVDDMTSYIENSNESTENY